jgi:hypothetical protein
MTVIVWFNLLMIHAGHVFWLGAFEAYEECHAQQVKMEEAYPEDKFLCPWTKMERV